MSGGKRKKNSRKTAVGVPVARQLKKNIEIINRTTIIRIRVQRVYNRTFEVQCSVREFKSSAQRNGTVYNEKSEVTETRSIKKKGKKKGSSDKKRKKKAKKGSRRTLFVYLKRMERKALLSQFGFFAKKIKEKEQERKKEHQSRTKSVGKLARNVTQVLGSGRRRQTNDSERFWLEGKGVSACVLVRTLLFAPFSSARRLFSSLPFAHCVSNKATGGINEFFVLFAYRHVVGSISRLANACTTLRVHTERSSCVRRACSHCEEHEDARFCACAL